MNKARLIAAVAVVGFALTVSAPASAGTGCNGVINPLVWGCAPWDNNNGPQFPNWKGGAVATKQPVPSAQQLKNAKLIGNDGSTLVNAGGMNKDGKPK